MHNPSENHVDAIMRILQYLKSAGKVLCFLGMDMWILQDIQTPIEVGKELKEGLLLATSHLWEVIYLLGKVRNRKLQPCLVQRPNTQP